MKRLAKNIIVLSALVLCWSFFDLKTTSAITYVSESQKQLIRDTKRLNDISVLKKAIEEYKNKNGHYPELSNSTGSIPITGYVNSAWLSQWNAFCGTIGLSECPIDPINKISNCECDLFGNDGCYYQEFLNKDTCYNTQMRSFICSKGSYIYQYKYNPTEKSYELSVEFEYKDDSNSQVSWMTNMGNIKTKETCENTGITLNPQCGDYVVQNDEECDGKNKIVSCTNENGEIGRMVVNCTSECKYEVKKTNNTAACITYGGICGDGEISDGEQCDGGMQRMCFSEALGYHNWHKEKIRYCNNVCKWNISDSDVAKMTSFECGGYCGDGVVQNEYEECDAGEEFVFWDNDSSSFKTCEDFSSDIAKCPPSKCVIENGTCKKVTTDNKHCYVRSGNGCMYVNTSPKIPKITNENFTVFSYAREGDFYSRSNGFINESTLKIDKIARNSIYIELSIDGIVNTTDGLNKNDADGDEIMYKFEFVDNTSNKNIGFFIGDYSKSGYDASLLSSRGQEVTGKWIKHSTLARSAANNGITSNAFIRIYTTEVSSSDSNTVRLIDGGYSGDYKIRISIKDSWETGDNVPGNEHGKVSSAEMSFHIGSSCGDYELQQINDEGIREACEWKAGYTKFFNWSTNEPSGNGYCAVLKTSSGWYGRWDDEDCNAQYRGLCRREVEKDVACNKAGENVWQELQKDANTKYCYALTEKTTYDVASARCIDNGSELVVIKNNTDNNSTADILSTVNFKDKQDLNGFLIGNNVTNNYDNVWIGYYNIEKIRVPKNSSEVIIPITKIHETTTNSVINQDSLWVPAYENGNPDIYANAIYDGGNGKQVSSQYLCSETCSDIGGYCGDGIIQNGKQNWGYEVNDTKYYTVKSGDDNKSYVTFYLGNFEECDPSAQGSGATNGQTGLGTGIRRENSGVKVGDHYGCISCRLNSGYCGDGSVEEVYESCDYRYAPTVAQSRRYGYVCANGISDNISGGKGNSADEAASTFTFKIVNPKTEGGMSYIPRDDKNNLMSLKNYYNNPENVDIKNGFKVNGNGACISSNKVSTDNANGNNALNPLDDADTSMIGYCGDGKIQMSYITYRLSGLVGKQDVTRRESTNSTDRFFNLNSENEKEYSSENLDSRLEFGTIKPGDSISSSDGRIIIGTTLYSTQRKHNNEKGFGVEGAYTSNWKKQSKYNSTTGVLESDDIDDRYWIEQCDPGYTPNPAETNDLKKGVFYSIVDEDLNFVSVVNFNGNPLLKYHCSEKCRLQTYTLVGSNPADFKGDAPKLNKDNDSEYGKYGYCGDGIVTTDDGEQCDPKDYIVGPNGSDSLFGDYADRIAYNGCRENNYINYSSYNFVYGKDCSTFVTPATSDSGKQYSCDYKCKVGGGYCGDGTVQSNFYEECDPAEKSGSNSVYSADGLINTKSNASYTKNYFCGVKNGYDGYNFDSEFVTSGIKDLVVEKNFSADVKSNNGKSASCKSFGGFCGDGLVQACKKGNNYYGGSEGYENCLRSSDQNSDDQNIISGKFVFSGSATMIETCDSLETACFYTDTANGVKYPVFEGVIVTNGGFDFKTSRQADTMYYMEQRGYDKSKIPADNGIANAVNGECSTKNTGNITSSEQLEKCSKGVATAVEFDGNTKEFSWSCLGSGGGLSASCRYGSSITGSITPQNGVCGEDSYPVCTVETARCQKCDNDICLSVDVGKACNDGADCNKNSNICVAPCTKNGEKVSLGEACNGGIGCGSVSGVQKFFTADSMKHLCNSGVPSEVSLNGKIYTWTCLGLGNGKASVTCHAQYSQKINGKVGTEKFTCDIGDATNIKYSGSGNTWTWECSGYNGGVSAKGSKGIDGWTSSGSACGSKNGSKVDSLFALKNKRTNDNRSYYDVVGLCSKGVPGSISIKASGASSRLTWKCGSGTTECYATIENSNSNDNACDTSKNFPACTHGYVTGVMYVANLDKVKWSCTGAPGVNASCEKTASSMGYSGEKINGKCGSMFYPFDSTSDVMNPAESKELENSSTFMKMFIAQSSACKQGTPIISQHTKTKNDGVENIRKCVSTNSSTASVYDPTDEKITYDCFKLVIWLPWPIDEYLHIFTMSLPWKWKCQGENGGEDSGDCGVFNYRIIGSTAGVCGSSNGKTVTGLAELRNKCDTGFASDISNISITSDNRAQVNWKCYGMNGGGAAPCSAHLNARTVINGEVNSSVNGKDTNIMSTNSSSRSIKFCNKGALSELRLEQEKRRVDDKDIDIVVWKWKCKGGPGGTTAYGTSGAILNSSGVPLPSLDGECGTPVKIDSSDNIELDGCSKGYVSNITYSNGKYRWNCNGLKNNANCEK